MSSPPHEATGAAAPLDDRASPAVTDPAIDRAERPAHASARPGQLTPAWQIAVTLAWVSTIVAQAGVWSASRQLGLSTWWLGAASRPQPVWIALAPFVPSAVVAVLALTGRRFVPWFGLVAAACIAAVGLGDLDRVTRLGIVELVIAAAAACVSIAGFAGTYRSAERAGG